MDALRRHWPEYLIEFAGLAAFMVSACLFATLLEHPSSPVRAALPSPELRRALIGMAMGVTAVAIIYSPWGQRSGAHINPAVTLTFLRLGKVSPTDAGFYVAAQFAGGVAGVLLARLALRELVADPAVNYVATVPGMRGAGVAFVAELAISFGLMATILAVSNRREIARLTGVFAGLLVALWITVEAPLSGMSMNPARTFGSAYFARVWTALWVYFTAPLLGMLLAAELHRRAGRVREVYCAKLHHPAAGPCLFRCRFPAAAGGERRPGAAAAVERPRTPAPSTAA